MTPLEQAARDLVSWMAKQSYGGENLLHAAVCCDHVGRERFISDVTKMLEQALARPAPSDDGGERLCKCDGASWSHHKNVCQECGRFVIPPRASDHPTPPRAADEDDREDARNAAIDREAYERLEEIQRNPHAGEEGSDA